MIETLKKKEFLHNLIHITRYSGLQLLKSESVSDHVWSMNANALALVPELNKRIVEYNQTSNETPIRQLSLREVIYKIVLHDIDETLYCDIPRPFKYHNDTIHNAIEDTAHQLMRENLGIDIVADIDNSKDWNTKEGVIVSILDTIQAGQKMIQEVRLGNSYLKKELLNIPEVFVHVTEYLDGMVKDKGFYKILKEFILEFIEEINKVIKS